MKYIIMLLIVIGAAMTDFITGFIKAYGSGTVNSRKMRIGGLGKVCEIVVAAASAGLNIGLDKLGQYYDTPQLTELAGTVTAFGVFFYITLMETVSVLENFSEIIPDAVWLGKLISRLRLLGAHKEDKDEYTDKEEE